MVSTLVVTDDGISSVRRDHGPPDYRQVWDPFEEWLAANVAPATVRDYSIMTGGFSRVMARVDLTWADGREETFVLRGDPPPELAALDSDRDAEWALLSDLTALGSVPMPAARWYVDTEDAFGTKAIFIDHVDGGSLQATLDEGRDHECSRRVAVQ